MWLSMVVHRALMLLQGSQPTPVGPCISLETVGSQATAMLTSRLVIQPTYRPHTLRIEERKNAFYTLERLQENLN